MNRADTIKGWPGLSGLYLRIGLQVVGGPQTNNTLLRTELVESRQRQISLLLEILCTNHSY